MTDSESACPRGGARPSWAPHADEADSRALSARTWVAIQRRYGGAIRGCGGLVSVIWSKRPIRRMRAQAAAPPADVSGATARGVTIANPPRGGDAKPEVSPGET